MPARRSHLLVACSGGGGGGGGGGEASQNPCRAGVPIALTVMDPATNAETQTSWALDSDYGYVTSATGSDTNLCFTKRAG